MTTVSGTAYQRHLLTLGKVEGKEETGVEIHPKGGRREMETKNEAKSDESQAEGFPQIGER